MNKTGRIAASVATLLVMGGTMVPTAFAASVPVVTSVNLHIGSGEGQQTVMITGSGFTGATEVDFGWVSSSGFVVVSDNEILVQSPPGVGTVDITVKTPSGTSATSSADQFTYVNGQTYKPTINPVTAGDTSITGTAQPQAKVYVSVSSSDGKTGFLSSNVTAHNDGTYSIPVPAGYSLSVGDQVVVYANIYGEGPNQSDPVYVTNGTTPTPTINPVKVGDTTITGTAEPNSVVSIADGSGSNLIVNWNSLTVADSNGNYTLDVSQLGDLLNAGDTIIVYAQGQNELWSSPVTTTVAPIVNAAVPTITTQPTNQNVNVGDSTTLSVAANVTDSGTLSYQWYNSPDGLTTDGTAIPGATSDTLNVPTTNVGTTLYYCIVTNTNNAVNGNQTASVTSDVVAVQVNQNAVINGNNVTFMAGQSYSVQLPGATGSTWNVVKGNLPNGLTLSNSGVISGTPTGQLKAYPVKIQTTDANGVTSQKEWVLILN